MKECNNNFINWFHNFALNVRPEVGYVNSHWFTANVTIRVQTKSLFYQSKLFLESLHPSPKSKKANLKVWVCSWKEFYKQQFITFA